MTVAVEPPNAFVKITGRAAVEGARDFKALVLRLSDEGVRHFVLELGECPLMDSTFSGVLAGLAAPHFTNQAKLEAERFTLVNANERVVDLLDNLGVLPLITRLQGDQAPPQAATGTELEPAQISRTEIATCCLDAHRILMALKPENVAKFRSVEQVLAAQLVESAH